MNRTLMGIVVVAFVYFCLAGQAMAAGFGGYLEGGLGNGKFEYDSSGDFDVDPTAGGFGLVFDTDLTDKGVFNYRLNVGYERLNLEDNADITLELDGLVVDNTFGFAIVRKPTFRWWVGPLVRVGIYNGNLDSGSSAKYDLVSFGVGGVTGVNFVNNNFCVSASLGLLTTGYGGETDEPGRDRDVGGATNTVFLKIAFLFGN